MRPMRDEDKTKQQLVRELTALRQRVEALEALEADRVRAEGALQKSETTARALLESASDGIVVVEADGRIVLVNAKLEEMFGYNREELLGQPVEILLPSWLFDVHTRHRADYLAHPHSRPMGLGFDLTGQRKEGSQFPVEVSLSCVQAEEGPLIMGFIVDITQRKQAEEALRQYTLELQARNEELDAFAHTVAHDLKNPLGRIVGFAELLEEDYAKLPDEELRHYLHMIAQNGRKMSNIIDELLLLSSVRQTEEAEMKPLDMARIVSEAQGRLADLIEKHQAEIILPESWPLALGHASWVEEVWVNYLSNAIQYGGQPPRIELGATGQADGNVRFWVRDNGAGFKPEERTHLFTPFTQLAPVRAEGHGLGLSIVRRIVERLGGQVGVESQIGQGSIFTFTLPAAGG
jgi:PAS domain S-box-containing protein